ncbi:MAG: protein disulfide isomerase family protein [bacterium]
MRMIDHPDKCQLIDSEEILDEILKSKKEVFVLFYASWCPYSRRFLPQFIDHAKSSDLSHMRIIVDDKDELVEKYNIEVYPTVLYFNDGKLAKRLDGIPHEGLDPSTLQVFVANCSSKTK